MTLELRIETCPSSGRSHSSAVRQRCASHVACELGTSRSWAPWTNRTGVLICLGSQAPGGDVGQVVVHYPALVGCQGLAGHGAHP